MKVAAVTDDGSTVSEHFGRAGFYVVYDIEDGKIKGKEIRPKASHQHPWVGGHEGEGPASDEGSFHNRMLAGVSDCQAVFARGMGWGMYQAMKQSGLKPYLIDIASADEAVRAFLEGRLVDHFERLH
jgi:predicted Fe-Mo cluster-binding NifX family protein